MSDRKRLAARPVALSLALLLASCSDSVETAEPTTTRSIPATTLATPTTAINTSTIPASTAPASTVPPATAPPATAPATTAPTDDAQVRSVFLAFFNGADRDIDKKVSLLQDGERYRQMLVLADADVRFQQLRAQVSSVRFPDGTECAAVGVSGVCAIVTFDLLLGPLPALSGQNGPAVNVAGTWKVGAKAFCDVAAISGAACPS